MDDDTLFGEAATQQGRSVEGAIQLLRQLETQLGSGPFYVYRLGDTPSGGSGGAAKQRTLFAFRSGDDALAFAQRNRLGPTPRLLRLTLAQVLTIMLHRPSVEAVLFVADVDDDVRPGQRPAGHLVARGEILAVLGQQNNDV